MTENKKIKIKDMPDLLRHFMINFGEKNGLPSDPEEEVELIKIEEVLNTLMKEAF